MTTLTLYRTKAALVDSGGNRDEDNYHGSAGSDRNGQHSIGWGYRSSTTSVDSATKENLPSIVISIGRP
ncbi:MAG: hypothetical protein R2867_46620, partial [Caldilineaceae bacterium]